MENARATIIFYKQLIWWVIIGNWKGDVSGRPNWELVKICNVCKNVVK